MYPFGRNLVHMNTAGQTHTHIHTHRETNCNENITTPQFCGGVKIFLRSGCYYRHLTSADWNVQNYIRKMIKPSHNIEYIIWISCMNDNNKNVMSVNKQ